MVDGTLVPARELAEDENDALTKSVATIAKTMLKNSDRPVQVVIPGRIMYDIRPKGVDFGDPVVVTGESGEVLLWLFGRDAVHLAITPEGAEVPRTGA